MRTCSKCKRKLDLSEFYLRKRGPRAGKYYEKCKECMKSRGIWYYHQNRARQLKLAIIRRHKARNIMRNFLITVKNKPCADCGKKFHFCAMDFDHRDGERKENEVASMAVGGWCKDKIEKEIEKCDLVCANCHRIRTYNRIHAEIA